MGNNRFDYLIEKIDEAPFTEDPFPHILINDFFSKEDFAEIISSSEIKVAPAKDDSQMLDQLFDIGYRAIPFPGAVTDKNAYLEWRRSGKDTQNKHSACEGFGMTLRLNEPKSDILLELKAFIEGDAFNRAMARRFDIPFERCVVDSGIQKYLDGYEISPHPDIRRKAATFMVNINAHERSEELEHHTQYLRFKPGYEYVRAFWEGNPDIDRGWVPWDWCETVSTQTQNNSIVIFSPSDSTMHGVKADYDHLQGQRTQLYGNLWYEKVKLPQAQWEEMDIRSMVGSGLHKGVKLSLKQQIIANAPEPMRELGKSLVRKFSRSQGGRNYS
ncbi:hypothetical protein H0274_09400 [Altererythrobacter sp. CC-YST694]|uniref:hypothetical protein n=1 Tax=Altererythrobacter sp. CC-YST694 TaxID=2755038 RepID=UPI001D017701|nr:hypothetical protein [Altererythrobacter sp. CC-YST694]MCB5425471.1 hypothetical protein [Altererythrobacter sp. CC-YST694]